MKTYELKVYHKSTTIDKVWVTIEANSPEEALALAKDSTDLLDWQDSKCIDVCDGEFIMEDDWEVVNELS